MEPFLISAGKSLISPFTKLISFVYRKLSRPSIERKKAPSNIFDHIKPGITFDRVREVLGTPYRRHDSKYLYNFSDLKIQIITDINGQVSSISAALSRITWRSKFKVPVLEIILGKTTFLDVLEEDNPIHSDSSSKHYHYWTEAYYGFPGLYFHYAFGAMEAPFINPPPSQNWSPNLDDRSSIPKNIKINWICISDSSEIPPFSYLGFL